MYKVSSRSSPRTVVVGVALVVFFFSGHGYRGRLIELQCELGRRERGSVSALKIEMTTSNLRFSNKMIQNFLQPIGNVQHQRTLQALMKLLEGV